MRVIQRPVGLLAGFIFLVILFTLGPNVYGQTSSSSGGLLELFQNLSPDQQQAILRQLGSGGVGGLLGGTGAGGTTTGARETGQTPEENLQPRVPRSAEAEGLNETLFPVLKADDWVIVEIDFHLPPRPLSQALQSLAPSVLAGGGGGISGVSPQQVQQIQAALASGSSASAAAAQAGIALPGAAAAGSSQASGSSLNESELPEATRRSLQAVIALIRSGNPYRLSADGVLNLPGFAGIALAGLTDEQATLRMKVEPALEGLDVRLTRLPLKKTGAEGLQPFGYDLFSRSPSTFAPVTNIPVPSDYVVGAGDQLSVQLYGSQSRFIRLQVGRDGRVSFPDIGPISVGGMLFSAVKQSIEARLEHEMIGVHASVSMDETRSIRVFVLGEVPAPGSYTISGLGTITSALYAAGGVKRIGSLRKIELKREGTLVRQLDLYDMLIRGDTIDDTKLLQGDVIFIPPVGPTVSIMGEVRRPAIYELKNEVSVAQLVSLAGGLTPQAAASEAMLTRIDENSRRVVLRVDLVGETPKTQLLRNGDLLRVPRLLPTLDSGVVLQGHVYTPGDYAYHPGIHLSDVIHSVDDLRPDADIHYVLIRRELPPDRQIVAVSANLAAALAAPGSKADLELMPRDRITVFDLASGRDRVIQPILRELRVQGTSQQPTATVSVDGRVKVPGEYPLESKMTISDLVRAGGGLADAAYGGKAELTRYEIAGGNTRRTNIVNIDLAAALRGDPTQNITLEPFDSLSVKELSQWREQYAVTLLGEVRFPGRYVIKSGETLKSVVARAGGLTEFAFPEGSVFTREQLKKLEQDQIDLLAQRTQTDLAISALQAAAAGLGGGGGGAGALAVGQSLLGQLKSAKAIGRLVIDLPALERAPVGSPVDVVLRDGDQLAVPKIQQQVTVIGEVQSVTSHLYKTSLSRDDYIQLSGGITRRADRSKIYVVRANGSVVASSGHRWFESENVKIKPGDTIVVPLDTTRLPALPFWQAVTGILYNIAIAVAAIHSL